MRARLVIEAANGPTTPEAETIFASEGIDIVPDILANAGGVIVSYCEWLQNKAAHDLDGQAKSTSGLRTLLWEASDKVVAAMERARLLPP